MEPILTTQSPHSEVDRMESLCDTAWPEHNGPQGVVDKGCTNADRSSSHIVVATVPGPLPYSRGDKQHALNGSDSGVAWPTIGITLSCLWLSSLPSSQRHLWHTPRSQLVYSSSQLFLSSFTLTCMEDSDSPMFQADLVPPLQYVTLPNLFVLPLSTPIILFLPCELHV